MSWIELKEHSDYIIFSEYPYPIVCKNTLKTVKEYTESNGYIRLNLKVNGVFKKFYKHVLIAKQFIENDDIQHKTQVDHINRIRSDNISNLRWCTPSENNKNRSSSKSSIFEYIDELPEDASTTVMIYFISITELNTENLIH